MKALSIVLVLAACGAGGLLLGGLARPVLGHARSAVPAASADSAPALALPATAPNSAAPRTVSWEDLTPKDWDPLKKFRGMNFDTMQDSDPKAVDMLKRMRETWDNAPTNREMDHRQVRIAGFVVPLDEGKSGLTRFLLVPYFGACIHTPPPPSNQIIDVTPATAVRLQVMEPVWVSGELRTLYSDTVLGNSSYRLNAVDVSPYEAPDAERAPPAR